MEQIAFIEPLPESKLVGHLRSTFQTNLLHYNTELQPKLLDIARRLAAKYPPKIKKLIAETGGTDIYLPIAKQLANIAESWIIDILNNTSPGNRPWALEPTPIPELPGSLESKLNARIEQEIAEALQNGVQPDDIEVKQRINELYQTAYEEVRRVAVQACKAQEVFLDDKLEEAGFIAALKQFVGYITKYPVAYLLGPILEKKVVLKWIDGELNEVEDLVPKYKAISPFDVFPPPTASKIEEGDWVVRLNYTKAQLQALKGLDGVFDDEIDDIVKNWDNYTDWISNMINESERDDLEYKNRHYSKDSGTVEVLFFMATVPSDTLISSEIVSTCVGSFMEIEAMLIGSKLIRCCIVDTKKPYFRRPLYFTSYKTNPDSIFGDSPITLAADLEDICNSTVRAMVNNLSISSGPQVALDPTALPAGEDLTNLYPWKIWQLTSINTSGQLPINFFQPPSNANELLQIFNLFLSRAAEIVGIPYFMGGANPSKGAASTAKGLSQLLEAASKNLKGCLSNISESIINPVVYQTFIYNMMNHKTSSVYIYGDVKVIPSGFNALVLSGAQEERITEFLQLVMSNPTISSLVGPEGLIELLKQYGRIANLDVSILPSVEDVKEIMAQQQEQTPPEVALEQAKLELDKYKHDSRMQVQQARLELDRYRADLQAQIAQLQNEVELQKENMKSQARLSETIAASIGKERIADKEIQVKQQFGTGI